MDFAFFISYSFSALLFLFISQMMMFSTFHSDFYPMFLGLVFVNFLIMWKCVCLCHTCPLKHK